ncbi:MAG: hypothetical protein KJ062_03140 [Thermoanaerobaculia bacterium]|nr:hypothetical protein [Thermoanaerobaculia bacterium]
MRVRLAHVALLALLFLPGCDNSSPTEPAACTNLGGTWRMSVQYGCGRGWADQVVITQRGCAISGASTLVPVSFEGTVAGKSVTIRFTIAGACPGNVAGTGSITLDGVIGSFQGESTGGPGCCAGTVNGTFTFLLPL